MSRNFRQHLPSIVGLVILFGSRILLYFAGSLKERMKSAQWIQLNLSYAWIITIILLAIVIFWERKPLTSISIRKLTGKDIFWAFIAFLLGGAIIMITMPLVSALGLGTTERGVQRLGEFSLGLRIMMVLTAGITEEIRYRGYLIERLNIFIKNINLSALISWMIFFILHFPVWGAGGAIQIGTASVVLYALYLWRRNLLACMLMHILNDAVAFLAVPAFLPKH